MSVVAPKNLDWPLDFGSPCSGVAHEDSCGSQFCNWRCAQFWKKITGAVSRQFELNGRKYWILSEPQGEGWKASVVELIDADGTFTEPVGIEASAPTQGAADEAAERKLRRLLQIPGG